MAWHQLSLGRVADLTKGVRAVGIPYRPRVRWTDLPDDGLDPKPDILSPKPGKTLDLVILSDRVLGVETHFVGGRTKPCCGDECSCIGCQQKLQTRWKGYLVVWIANGTPQAIAELTTEAFRRCPPFHSSKTSLRGRKLKLTRPAGKPNGRVKAEVGDFVLGWQNLPLALDLECALYRIWFTTRKHQPTAGAPDPGPGPDLNDFPY
jgi:hypothetical protein